MGILDDIQPSTRKIRPTDIAVKGSQLAITWDDSRHTLLGLKFLRTQCPCAGCVDEWSGKRTLDPASIRDDVRPVKLDPIGRYALQIAWSDGHGSGIYSWELLERLVREQPRGQA